MGFLRQRYFLKIVPNLPNYPISFFDNQGNAIILKTLFLVIIDILTWQWISGLLLCYIRCFSIVMKDGETRNSDLCAGKADKTKSRGK